MGENATFQAGSETRLECLMEGLVRLAEALRPSRNALRTLGTNLWGRAMTSFPSALLALALLL